MASLLARAGLLSSVPGPRRFGHRPTDLCRASAAPTAVRDGPHDRAEPTEKPAARCARNAFVGAAGCCFGRTDRNPFGPADRWLLIGCVGGAVLQRRLGHPRPYEPKSAQPTGSLSLLGGVLTGAPPWLEAFEVHQRHYPNCTSGGRAVSRRRRVAVRRCGVGIRRQEQQEVKQKQGGVQPRRGAGSTAFVGE